MKRKAKWDEYIKTPVGNFKYRQRVNWFMHTAGGVLNRLVDRVADRLQTIRDNERGSRLGKTMLDEPITLGGWDKKLRRRK